MARWHLFEWEDQAWFPSTLRDYGTDFLNFLAEKTNMYEPIVPIIEEALAASGSSEIVDLASGGGGGLMSIYLQLTSSDKPLSVTLTDLYPNQEAFERIAKAHANISLEMAAIDATDVPVRLSGLRTMFLSFHHFQPDEARSILQDAVDKRMPIAIFEAQERSLPSMLAMLFSPITVLLTTPLIRPFRLGRLFFTYLVPLVPLLVLWDGVVSALRTYSVREMQSLISNVRNHEQFEWRAQKVKSGPGNILLLVGVPSKPSLG